MNKNDVAIGTAASGTTPYVVGVVPEAAIPITTSFLLILYC
jgi:N-acetylmuramic acid 6-phosphate (MurNAc-6-P) etherase